MFKLFSKSREVTTAVRKNRRGTSSVEYALIAGGIAIAVIAGLVALKPQITASMNAITASLAAQTPS